MDCVAKPALSAKFQNTNYCKRSTSCPLTNCVSQLVTGRAYGTCRIKTLTLSSSKTQQQQVRGERHDNAATAMYAELTAACHTSKSRSCRHPSLAPLAPVRRPVDLELRAGESLEVDEREEHARQLNGEELLAALRRDVGQRAAPLIVFPGHLAGLHHRRDVVHRAAQVGVVCGQPSKGPRAACARRSASPKHISTWR